MPYAPWLFPGRPFWPLTSPVRKRGGRSAVSGRLIVRGWGGGHKRRFRHLDAMRLEPGPQDVVRIEYDPNRSAHIALLRNRTGSGSHGGWSYIIAPDGLRAGDVVESFRAGVPKGLVPKWDDEIEQRVEADKRRIEAEELDKILKENEDALIETRRQIRRGIVIAQGAVPDIPSIAAPTRAVDGPDSLPSIAAPFSATTTTTTTKADDESDWVDEDVETAFTSVSTLPPAYLSSPAPPALRDFHIQSSPAYSTAHLDLIPPRPKPASILPLRVTGRLPGTVAFHDAGGGGSTPSFALNLLRSAIIKPGNVVAIGLVPVGQPIHNIALKPDGPMMLCRAAGTSGSVVAHQRVGLDGLKITHIKLQSGEIRRVPSMAPCTVGQTSK